MPNIFTKPSIISEAEVAKLTKVYKEAYKQVVNEIITIQDLKVRTRKQKLAQIRGILVDLKVDVDQFIEKEIETAYKGGALDAVKDLKWQGYDGRLPETGTLNRLHEQAIASLVSETQEAYALGIDGMMKDVKVILGAGFREQIARRLLEGEINQQTLIEVKKLMVQDLEARGLTALVDRGGRTWELDRYAEMLIRTKGTEATNRGTGNRLAELGMDLVIVSSHNSEHQECAVWEGRILSLTGASSGYPTVDDAKQAGLWHPNCKHRFSAFIPKLNPDYVEPVHTKVTIENLDTPKAKSRLKPKIKITVEDL